jgi:anaerobic selenocysteine-containing dehydrogenase
MTESMRHCDVVLPSATHFEYDDLYAAYGHHWLQRAEPVIPPLGESLPNTELFRRLATRFGFTDSCFTASDKELMDDAVDAADPRMQGIKGSEVRLSAALHMTAPDGRSSLPCRQHPAGNAVGQGRACLRRWRSVGAHARLPSYRPPTATCSSWR